MRVRPVVTVIVAVLVLGACGSSGNSAAREKVAKPTSTTSMGDMAGMDHGTMAASTPVTDLNGHRVVRVKAQDV